MNDGAGGHATDQKSDAFRQHAPFFRHPRCVNLNLHNFFLIHSCVVCGALCMGTVVLHSSVLTTVLCISATPTIDPFAARPSRSSLPVCSHNGKHCWPQHTSSWSARWRSTGSVAAGSLHLTGDYNRGSTPSARCRAPSPVASARLCAVSRLHTSTLRLAH